MGGAQTIKMGLKGRTGMTRGVVRKPEHSGKVWEGLPKGVRAAYAKRMGLHDAVPEYGGARGTLPESGSTTIQG